MNQAMAFSARKSGRKEERGARRHAALVRSLVVSLAPLPDDERQIVMDRAALVLWRHGRVPPADLDPLVQSLDELDRHLLAKAAAWQHQAEQEQSLACVDQADALLVEAQFVRDLRALLIRETS